jgi:hypothetical protein
MVRSTAGIVRVLGPRWAHLSLTMETMRTKDVVEEASDDG